MERHTHEMWHEHNRGSMNIQGYFANVVTANGRVASGAFSETHWDSTHKFSEGGQWLLQAGNLNLNANDNWIGQTSGPLDISGNAIYNTGINSGRTWDTTHGKRIGVYYLIKAL